MAGALVWAIGVEEDGVEENGCQSGAVTETRESAWTPGGDGCSAGDPIKTDDDAPRSVEEEDSRSVTAIGAVPFEPRQSPRIAVQTQTRVEPRRRSPRIAANRLHANSLLNVGSQPRRSPRIAAVRLMRGV